MKPVKYWIPNSVTCHGSSGPDLKGTVAQFFRPTTAEFRMIWPNAKVAAFAQYSVFQKSVAI